MKRKEGERDRDAQLDTALDEVDRLGRAEERPHDRVPLGHLEPNLLPLLGVADAPAPLLVDVAVVGRALELLQERVALLEERRRRVRLERDDALREGADARVRRQRDGRVPARCQDVDLDVDGALLGHAEARERHAVRRVDAREALVEHERDAVLAVARLERRSEVGRRAVAADLLVEPGREDDGAAGRAKGQLGPARVESGGRDAPSRLEVVLDELVERGEEADELRARKERQRWVGRTTSRAGDAPCSCSRRHHLQEGLRVSFD